MEKLILTDVDGVLLDWETAFHDWMKTKGFVADESQYSYDMHIRFDMQKHKIKELIVEFNESAWICCLKPLRDAVDGISRLAEAGYRFGAITSLSVDPYAAKLREQNLITVFGDVWNFIQCLDTGADKDQALVPYRDSGLIWVEDKPENAQLGADLGLKTFMIRHRYNANFSYCGVKSVDNWAQIVNAIV